jgi:hypothetical protein
VIERVEQELHRFAAPYAGVLQLARSA